MVESDMPGLVRDVPAKPVADVNYIVKRWVLD